VPLQRVVVAKELRRTLPALALAVAFLTLGGSKVFAAGHAGAIFQTRIRAAQAARSRWGISLTRSSASSLALERRGKAITDRFRADDSRIGARLDAAARPRTRTPKAI
jgi:hypothetical protein